MKEKIFQKKKSIKNNEFTIETAKKSLANDKHWKDNFYHIKKLDAGLYWDNSIYANRKIQLLLNKYLPKGNRYKALEVGCCPGDKLVFLKNHFGYSIYGVELIKESVEATKLNLKKFNIQGKIIHSDFFNKSFLKKYESSFDIIFDYGFSEHFEDFEGVINEYSKLLKKRGVYVVIIIPNFGGLYKRFVSKDLLKIHNLKIMDIHTFESIIGKNFNKLFCNYVGGLYTDSSEGSVISLLLDNKSLAKVLLFLFKYFNKIMIHLPLIESKILSPYLVYIGKKKYEK